MFENAIKLPCILKRKKHTKKEKERNKRKKKEIERRKELENTKRKIKKDFVNCLTDLMK